MLQKMRKQHEERKAIIEAEKKQQQEFMRQ